MRAKRNVIKKNRLLVVSLISTFMKPLYSSIKARQEHFLNRFYKQFNILNDNSCKIIYVLFNECTNQ